MTKAKKTADKIAEKGRGKDSLVGHLTPGDLIIPAELRTAEMTEALKKHFAAHGTSAEKYTAGNKENSINPETGQPEFGFWKNPFKSIGNVVSNIISDPWPTVGTVLGAAVGGPFGAAAGNALGSAASQGPSKAFGSGLSDTLKSSALAGATTYGAGKLASAFPETASAIGDHIPTLGIGDFVSNVGKSTGVSDLFNGGASDAVSAAGTGTSDLPWLNSGVTAGGNAAASAAPSGIDLPWLDETSSAASSVPGSDFSLPMTTNIGSGTVGTQGIENAATGFYDLNGNFNAPSAAGISPSLASAAGKAVSAAPSSISNFIDNPSLSSFGNIISSNPGAALSAAGLGITALKGNQSLSGEGALKDIAGTFGAQGQELQKYLQNGTLPPGLQGGINQAAEAAKATIRSKYASMGMSGSSSEQQDLAAVDSRAQAQGAQMAMQLLSTGINETGMSAGLYEKLMGNALAEDKDLGTAIANFAASAAGGGAPGKSITLNV